MADLQDFTPEELSLLARAAVLAGGTVALVRFSGARGTENEFHAILDGLHKASRQYPANPLVQALLTDETRAEVEQLAPRFHKDPKQRTYDDFKLAALNRCGQAADLLARKATSQQAEEVKQSILLMCREVAERSKEGTTFMGLGGTRVDPMELAAIEQVKTALGVTA